MRAQIYTHSYAVAQLTDTLTQDKTSTATGQSTMRKPRPERLLLVIPLSQGQSLVTEFQCSPHHDVSRPRFPLPPIYFMLGRQNPRLVMPKNHRTLPAMPPRSHHHIALADRHAGAALFITFAKYEYLKTLRRSFWYHPIAIALASPPRTE